MANNSDRVLSGEKKARLSELARAHFKEAMECSKAGAYVAACIMLAATFEAHLLVLAVERQEKGKWLPHGKKQLTCGLDDLLILAEKQQWLPKDLIGDVREMVVPLRNAAVHPGRWIKEGRSVADFDEKQVAAIVHKVIDMHLRPISALVRTLEDKLPPRNTD